MLPISAASKLFARETLFTQLAAHLVLGLRELRDSAHYQDDLRVQRVLGLKRLPDVGTLSRMLKGADPQSVDELRQLRWDMVRDRLCSLALPRITLDFDGSVPSTKRRAEGTAVGFNKKKRGAAVTTRDFAWWLKPGRRNWTCSSPTSTATNSR